MSNGSTPAPYAVGVLALQGAFQEHINMLARLRLPLELGGPRLNVFAVRTKEDLEACSALVIPGGESTAMAKIAERSDLLDDLVAFCQDPDRPVLGTCAGMIMLSSRAEGARKGGQALFGGMGTTVMRNGFGSQLESFESELVVTSDKIRSPEVPFLGVFIRAPMVLLTTTGEEAAAPTDAPKVETALPATATASAPSKSLTVDTEILLTLPFSPSDAPSCTPFSHIVALRQGRKVACSFHPELSQNHMASSGGLGRAGEVGVFGRSAEVGDARIHEFWVRNCCLQKPVGV